MPTRSRLKADSPSTAQPEQVIAPLTASDDGLPNRIGMVIDGRYRIDDLIAEGGMAVVFRARNLRLDRDVAVKVFHPATSPMPHGELRFEREAKAIARLDHANCVSVQDFGHLGDGSLFLVMPYLEGVVLTDAIAGVPMESERALYIAHHLLRGIAHAHAAGIVHRDIKPDNILLVQRDDDYVPVILDFGIAKTTESEEDENPDARLTRVGQRFGTPAYMSPEQVTGTDADARSDVYSLSVVLFEMLTGKAPFAGNSQETMMMHVTHEVPDLNDCVPERFLSEQIVRLVAKGLAKDPGSRFQSAEEFLHALDACCALPEVAPVSQPEPAKTIGQHISLLPTPAVNEAPPGQANLVSGLRAKMPELLRLRIFRIAVGVAILALLLVLVWPTDSATNHAKHAAKLLTAGKPSEAVAYLEEQPAVSKRDGAMLQLGHAYAALRAHSKAVDAYKQAHALNKKYAENSVMQTNLMLMLEDNSDATAGIAGRFLVEDLKFEAASTRIAEIASGHRTLRHRHLMRTLAEEFDLELDRTQSYQLDLLQEDECEDRKTIVAKLRAIGDPSSIASLKRARKRANNVCLRADATAAIQYLQSLEDSGSETNSQ